MQSVPKLIRPLLVLAVLAATVVAVSGCGTTTADTARGRTLFIQNCGTCHTLAEAGSAGTQGPDLDDAFAAARESGQNSDTIEGIVKAQVENPRPVNGDPAVSMPSEIVTGQDLSDVIAYVGSVAGVPGAAPPKVPGGPGAQVFASKGCGGCHTFKAAKSGGVTGPNLDESLAPDDTAAAIEEMIVDPNAEIVQGYPPNVMPSNFGEIISKKELEQLVEFLIKNSPAGEGKSAKK
jgi:mono/diheme cytochrome c family protein